MRRFYGLGILLFLFLKMTSGQGFVEIKDHRFYLHGQPYRFIGTNFWYGMFLGVPQSGNRDRLLRELDHLDSLGLKNLRIMACAEGPDNEPWRAVPTLQPAPGMLNEDLLLGLDFLLAEMGKRKMHAVVCLSNFWPWTGGMAQYVSWSQGSKIPYPPPRPGGSWVEYQLYTSRFYADGPAMEWYEQFVKHIVTRVNSISGVAYRDDPGIMAWQLANEPRGITRARKYRRWVKHTAAMIKNLDPRHLVSIGSEGFTSSQLAGNHFIKDHRIRDIDYATIHVWVENWGWYDPVKAEQTYESGLRKAGDYIGEHIQHGRKMGKPVVLEEFGIARDAGSVEPLSTVVWRDRYYRDIMHLFLEDLEQDSPWCGLNFWAWSGEGKVPEPGGFWKPGMDFLGDPPHEKQGWYGVYQNDRSTLELLKEVSVKVRGF